MVNPARQFLTVAVLSSLAVALSACTGQSSQRWTNEGPVDYSPPVTTAQAKSAVNDLYNQRYKIDKILTDPKTSQSDLQNEIGILERIVLNDSVLEGEWGGSAQMTGLIGLYNKGLLRELRQYPNDDTTKQSLKKYLGTVLEDCGPQLNGCTKAKIFSHDYLSAQILVHALENLKKEIEEIKSQKALLAKSGKDLTQINGEYTQKMDHFMRMISLAYDLSNAEANRNLDILLIQFGPDYFELHPSDQTADVLRRHQTNLTLALDQMRGRTDTASQKQYCEILQKMNPIEVQTRSIKWVDQRAVRGFVGDYLSCLQKNGHLNDAIAGILKEETQSLDQKWDLDHTATKPGAATDTATPRLNQVQDLGYEYALRSVFQNPAFAHGLGLQNLHRDDLAFFVLDRLFYERMSSSLAQSYWRHIGHIDDAQLFSFVRNYARVQVAYVLKNTVDNFRTLLINEFNRQGSLGPDSFKQITEQLNLIAKLQWATLNQRLGFLKEFLVQNYDQKYAFNVGTQSQRETMQSYNNLKTELDDLPTHMGLSVINPLNMILYYYMSKAAGSVQFHVSWSSNDFKMDASEMLKDELRGGSQPRFPLLTFGKPLYSFDDLQTLHSLDFAFRIGLFDLIPMDLNKSDKDQRAFPNGTSSENAEFLFFKQVFKNFFSNDQQALEKKIDQLQKVEQDENFTSSLMGLCEDPLQTHEDLDAQTLFTRTMLANTSIQNVLNQIYESPSALENWRNDERYVNRFLVVLRTHLFSRQAQQNLSPEKFQNRTDIWNAIQTEFRTYADLESQYVKLLMDLDRQIVNEKRNCLDRIYAAEGYRRGVIYQKNIDFYRDVHAAMTVLRLIGNQSLSLDEIRQTANAYPNHDVAIRMLALLKEAELNRLFSSPAGGFTQADLQPVLDLVLGVHNHAELKNVGFFVSGVPEYIKGDSDHRDIKRMNEITANWFTQARWDTFARIRWQLQNLTVSPKDANTELGTAYTGTVGLGPNVSIRLGSFGELENSGIYSSNQVQSVKYNSDPDTFVRSCMSQLAGASDAVELDWSRPSGMDISYLKKRLSLLLALYDFPSLEASVNDHVKCAMDEFEQLKPSSDFTGGVLDAAALKKGCQAVKVTAKDVINAFLDVVDFSTVSGFSRSDLRRTIPLSDREILDWLGQRQLQFSSDVTKSFAYNGKQDTKDWTYFDEFFRKNFIYDSRTGAEGVTGENDYLSFKKQFESEFRSSGHIFPVNPTVTQIERNYVREPIIEHIRQAKTFERTVMDMENKKVALPDLVFERVINKKTGDDYIHDAKTGEDWRAMLVRARNTGSRSGTPIYMKDDQSAKSWFESSIANFMIKESDCDALPRTGDPDSTDQTASSGSCTSRFESWASQVLSPDKGVP